jgi:RNA polymerase sigma-70 factor (ECF subfamily)
MTEDPFVTHRNLLFTVAYELLGSATDAEDVLQEAWLRWAEVDQSQVRDARAYLIRVVTRQALNQMRTFSRRREEYVGEWLPEPLLTSPDVAEDVELAGRIEIDGQLAAVSLVVENGRITRIYAVANPQKLTRLDELAELAR